MSSNTTIVSKRRIDRNLIRKRPCGPAEPVADPTDWKQLQALTDEEVEAAAARDPDARPLSDAAWEAAPRVPRARTLRRALGLTQEEFAARFHIPIGTLRDWEQGRAQPDQTARAYLRAIAGNPDAVRKALEAGPRRI